MRGQKTWVNLLLFVQASALAGGAGRMRQQLQQHLASLASFKGRSSGSGALALPPVGGLHDDTGGETEVSIDATHADSHTCTVMDQAYRLKAFWATDSISLCDCPNLQEIAPE